MLAHEHKTACIEKIKPSITQCQSAQEGDCIRPLESHKQPLEQEHSLSSVLSHCNSASALFCTGSMANWPHVPAVSTATGKKDSKIDSTLYLAVLLTDALLAAASGSLAAWPMCTVPNGPDVGISPHAVYHHSDCLAAEPVERHTKFSQWNILLQCSLSYQSSLTTCSKVTMNEKLTPTLSLRIQLRSSWDGEPSTARIRFSWSRSNAILQLKIYVCLNDIHAG